MPLSNLEKDTIEEPETSDEKMLFQLDEDVKEIKVTDPIELISVTEVSEEGEKRYALEEFSASDSSSNTNTELEVKEEIVFEKKILPVGNIQYVVF